MNGDWLDRLAGRAVRGRRDGRERVVPSSSDDERFSRARAVKLAIAGVASVSFGLWRAPPAMALTVGECVEDCNRRFDKFDDKMVDACFEEFGADRKWAERTPAWKQLLLWAALPGTMVQNVLASGCQLAGAAVSQQAREKCWRGCQKNCSGSRSRSLQSASVSRDVCRPPPPPKPYTPALPPPPNMTEDPCLACNQVGGLCCGPFKAGADGRFLPCACGNPSIACERYACG